MLLYYKEIFINLLIYNFRTKTTISQKLAYILTKGGALALCLILLKEEN